MSMDIAYEGERSAAEDAGWAYIMGRSALERLTRLHASGCAGDDPEVVLLGGVAELYLCDLQDFLVDRWHECASAWSPTEEVAHELRRLSARPIRMRTADRMLEALETVWASFYRDAAADRFRLPAPGCRLGV